MHKILKSPLLVFAVIAFILAGCTSSAAEKEETDDARYTSNYGTELIVRRSRWEVQRARLELNLREAVTQGCSSFPVRVKSW